MRRRYLLAGLPLLAGSLAACGTSSAAAQPKPVITVNVAERGTLPGTGHLEVSVTHGTLRQVAVTGRDGALHLRPASGRTWSGPGDMTPYRTYRLTVLAAGSDGDTTRLVRTFRTGEPAEALGVTVFPSSGQEVGVGQPVIVTLSAPVKDRPARAEVERALTVSADRPVTGSWAWLNDNVLHYRPKAFWPAHTHVTVHLDVRGVRASPGVWGTANRTETFRTGAARIVRVDDAKHRLTVTTDGTVVRTVPVSLGKAGYETRSGTKVVMQRFAKFRMDSTTVGITDGPDVYDLDVPYALRITNSGEFIHGAPWNHQLGKANISHGCTNVGLADARWLYENLRVGDPVITTGTGRAMEPTNGWGDWNVSWSDWTAKSALSG